MHWVRNDRLSQRTSPTISTPYAGKRATSDAHGACNRRRQMLPGINPGLITLSARGIYRIEDGAGLLIECLSGALWITQAGDHRDITLERGQSFDLHRGGMAIVYGLGAARFRVEPAPPEGQRRIEPAPEQRAA